jgi:hypothetical protein
MVLIPEIQLWEYQKFFKTKVLKANKQELSALETTYFPKRLQQFLLQIPLIPLIIFIYYCP